MSWCFDAILLVENTNKGGGVSFLLVENTNKGGGVMACLLVENTNKGAGHLR